MTWNRQLSRRLVRRYLQTCRGAILSYLHQRLARHASTVLLIVCLVGCAPRGRVPLTVFFAGSLIVPIADMEAAFEKAHPGIDVLTEGHGSIQVIRHVTELHDLVDVVLTADHVLIPALMYQTTDEETGHPYADWYVEFATNQLTLAFTDQSQYADEVNVDNWYEVLARPGVRLGLPDPRFDAAGYRGLMALQLAEAHYGDPMIFEGIVGGSFRSPITAREETGRWVIRIPEVVEPKRDSNILIRGGSIQLIALLESGDIDYAVEYESVSQQHGFRFVPLPDAIDMGTEAYGPQYGQVEVRLDFQRFASVTPVFPGEFIGYGVTVPTNAPHPQQAMEFVEFLLGPEGQQIMEANHHPMIIPPRLDRYDTAPQVLQETCVPMR